MSKFTLNGVAWAHQRCWGPLEDLATMSRCGNGKEIQWSRRSLFSFGEGDLDEFAGTNDLIIFDHPFTGDVARKDLMLDLRQFLSNAEIQMLEQNQVGAAYRSYHFEGGIFALPIDCAATTAAWRPDLMEGLSAEVPGSIDGVYKLAELAQKNDKWVAWAAKPTDLFCSYIAMLASLDVNVGHEKGPFAPKNTSSHVVDEMKKLRDIVHPNSFKWNPILLFDHMVSNDDIIYVPFAFNYVNYCTKPQRHLKFGSSPRMDWNRKARGVLGGAGIGVSSKSQNPQRAFRYAMQLINPTYQSSDYVIKGGQSGMRSAWISEDCDRITNGFFSGCREALDNAFLRPTIPGFVNFFHEGTHKLTAVVTEDASHDEFWEWLTKFYDILRENAQTKVGRG